MKVKTEDVFLFYSLVFFTLLSFSYFSILNKKIEMLLWQLAEIKYFIYIYFLFLFYFLFQFMFILHLAIR